MSIGSREQIGGRVFNVPNQLTAVRLLLALITFALIPLQQYIVACVVFGIAAGTDWIDGWWARRFDQVTKLGRIFDPFVDKIIICGTFILLSVEMKGRDLPWYAVIAGWMAVVVVAREMLVTALRSFIEQSGGDFSASWPGKLKMGFQCAAVIAALITLTFESAPPAWVFWALVVSVWLAVLSTIYSGLDYIVAATRYFRT